MSGENINSSQAIVLGGGLRVDGEQTFLSPNSQQRAMRTAEFYHANRHDFSAEDSVIVASGGSTWLSDENYSRSEASLVADVLMDSEVPSRLIELEENSHDTLTNFLNSSEFFNFDEINEESPLAVVTQEFHYRRAKYLGHKALGVSLQKVEADGENGARRAMQEIVLNSMSHAFLVGVEPGDQESARQRADKMARVVSALRKPLDAIMLRG